MVSRVTGRDSIFVQLMSRNAKALRHRNRAPGTLRRLKHQCGFPFCRQRLWRTRSGALQQKKASEVAGVVFDATFQDLGAIQFRRHRRRDCSGSVGRSSISIFTLPAVS